MLEAGMTSDRHGDHPSYCGFVDPLEFRG